MISENKHKIRAINYKVVKKSLKSYIKQGKRKRETKHKWNIPLLIAQWKEEQAKQKNIYIQDSEIQQ